MDPRVSAQVRQPAVKWLSVRQLIRTALEVMKATWFARFADKRDVIGTVRAGYYALTPPNHTKPVRVDFTADTGDGFDATFAVARLLAGGQSTDADVPDQGPAELLVLGGDEVYPVASADNYRQRFTAVFRAARSSYPQFLDHTHGPPVLALPGNHDWYDGLSAFRRTFCESWTRMDDELDPDGLTKVGCYESDEKTGQREVAGGWTTIQSRSYFAIRVHPKWWIWGVDSQLNAPIDAAQLAYFQQAKRLLKPDDGVVLLSATPNWKEADGDSPPDLVRETPLSTMVNFLHRYDLLPPDRQQLRMILTGDTHHYARYLPADPQPDDGEGLEWCPGPALVTCGGGGAFTSPTHHLKETLSVPWRRTPPRDVTRYRLDKEKVYPRKDESKKLRREIWTMGSRNGPVLPALIGALLAVVFWTVADRQLADVVHPTSAVAAIVLALVLCAYAATGIRGKRGSPWQSRLAKVVIAGVGHTVLHLAAVALVAWVFMVIDPPTLVWVVAGYLALVVLGTLAFTVYLVLCERFGFHELEAFSSIRSEKFKCVLRLTFDHAKVSVEVVGLDRVPSARSSAVGELKPRQIDYFEVSRTG
ncbi:MULTISPECIES: metallophosphoesterase [unclassified Kribbella]|uniref:metallophosphoesterase n=1 Tax=unclassified Kribbella TaxID=2644121 RepID=UPI0030191A83